MILSRRAFLAGTAAVAASAALSAAARQPTYYDTTGGLRLSMVDDDSMVTFWVRRGLDMNVRFTESGLVMGMGEYQNDLRTIPEKFFDGKTPTQATLFFDHSKVPTRITAPDCTRKFDERPEDGGMPWMCSMHIPTRSVFTLGRTVSIHHDIGLGPFTRQMQEYQAARMLLKIRQNSRYGKFGSYGNEEWVTFNSRHGALAMPYVSTVHKSQGGTYEQAVEASKAGWQFASIGFRE